MQWSDRGFTADSSSSHGTHFVHSEDGTGLAIFGGVLFGVIAEIRATTSTEFGHIAGHVPRRTSLRDMHASGTDLP